MSFEDGSWISRAQAAEAKLATQKQAYEGAIERIQQFKTNFGVREKSTGEIVVDYAKFVEALGPYGYAELRLIGDERWSVTGAPGEKPRIRALG